MEKMENPQNFVRSLKEVSFLLVDSLSVGDLATFQSLLEYETLRSVAVESLECSSGNMRNNSDVLQL